MSLHTDLKPVLKFKSENLYGETRKQEKLRLLKARIKARLEGKSRNVSFGAGTTKEQREKRRKILKAAGLSTKTPKYFDVYQ